MTNVFSCPNNWDESTSSFRGIKSIFLSTSFDAVPALKQTVQPKVKCRISKYRSPYSDGLKSALLVCFILAYYIRKLALCICKKKGADQLCGDHTADQCLCFHYIDSTIPLLPNS